METKKFYCRRCGSEIYPANAQKEYGDIFIVCVYCEAKNIIAPFVFNKIVIRDLWQITGWRDYLHRRIGKVITNYILQT